MDPTAYLIRTLEKEKRALQVQNNILQEKNDVLQEEKDALSIQLVDTHRKNINTRRKNVELKYKLYQAKVEVQSMRRLMLAQPPPLIESDWDSEHHDTEISDTEVEAAQDSLREILAELDASDTKSQESYEENDFTSDLDNENDTVLAEGSEEMDLVSRTGQPINMDSEGEESEIGTNINKLSEEKVTDSDDEEDTMMGDFNFVQELFHPKNEPDTENESDAESNSNMSIDLVRHIMEQSTAGKHEILSRSGPIWEAQKGAMKNAIEGFAFYKRMVTFHVVWENGGNDWKTKLRGAGYKVDQKPQRGNQGHPGKGMTADVSFITYPCVG